MRVISLELVPPSGHAAIVGPDATRALENACDCRGWAYASRRVRTLAEFEREVADLVESAPGPCILVLGAHGKQAVRKDRTEPLNLLMLEETNPDDRIRTSIDLDELMHRLNKNRCDVLVVVDACGVDARSAREERTVSILLASPGGVAEQGSQGGILTSQFVRALDSASTVREAASAAIRAVTDETGGRQHPVLRPGAPTGVLAVPASRLAGTGSVADRLLEIDLVQPLDAQLASVLLEGLGTGEGPHARAVRAVVLSRRVFRRDAESLSELEKLRIDDLPARVRARAGQAIGWGLSNLGDAADSSTLAVSPIARALEDARSSDSRVLESQIRDTFGTVWSRTLNWKRALEHYGASVDLKEEVGDWLGVEMSTGNLVWLHLARGEFLQAEAVAFAAVQRCEQRLVEPAAAAARPGVGITDAATSLWFALHGLLTAKLIIGSSKRDVGALRGRVGRAIAIAESVRPWGDVGPAEAVHALFDLMTSTVGVDGVRLSRRTLDVLGDELRAVVQLASGDADSEGVRKLLVESAGNTSDHKERVRAVAAASWYLHRHRFATSEALVRDVLSAARAAERSIDDESSWPWSVGRQRRRFNLNGMLRWGPLEALHEEMSAEDVVVHVHPLEQYLETIAWCFLLVFSAQGHWTSARLAAWLSKKFEKGGELRLGLGPVLGACRDLLSELAVECSIGVPEFDAAFTDHGYEDYTRLVFERNDIAHNRPVREAELEQTLTRFESVIVSLCQTFGTTLQEYRIRAGSMPMGGGIRFACIEHVGTGSRWDCGPLLAVSERSERVVYLPRFLSRRVLEGARRGSCQYQSRSGTAFDSGRSQVKVTIDPIARLRE